MHTLRIEHAIGDYDTWKMAFDRDPAHRRESGVRRYHVTRPSGDRHHVMIDLEFDASSEAEALLDAMQRVWRSREAAPALAGAVQASILETLERRELQSGEAP
jgi:hypothetical protein